MKMLPESVITGGGYSEDDPVSSPYHAANQRVPRNILRRGDARRFAATGESRFCVFMKRPN